MPPEPTPTPPTPTPPPSPTPTPPPEPTPPPTPTPEEAAKVEADKKAAEELAAKNDTKANPFDVKELVPPEGLVLDQAMATGFVGLINKYGIPRDAVAELAKLQFDSEQARSVKEGEKWTEVQNEWRKQAEADPTIGGSKLPETLATVGRFMATYGDDEARAAFDLTGAGNHPAIVRMLAKAGALLKEGTPVSGTPTEAPKSAAERIFPNQGKT